ncbi:MAG: hypothetical protein H7062_09925 [Candidatus Saccharimonas sp.]|nr:hypothetical protein [Planctomycetaceae bacterium]
MAILGKVLLGLVATYLVATISESLLHRFVLHASVKTRRFWVKYPGIFGHLLRAHYRHAVVHHGLTFCVNHVTQFENAEARAEVERSVAPRSDKLIQREQYGLTIGLRGFVTYNLTVVPIIPLLYGFAGPWALWGAVPVLTLAPLSAMLVHPFLHRHQEAAARGDPAVARLLMRTWYYQRLSRHHFLHHKYGNCNFNLLLGGDRLLGTHRSPTAQDMNEMAEIGISVLKAAEARSACPGPHGAG